MQWGYASDQGRKKRNRCVPSMYIVFITYMVSFICKPHFAVPAQRGCESGRHRVQAALQLSQSPHAFCLRPSQGPQIATEVGRKGSECYLERRFDLSYVLHDLFRAKSLLEKALSLDSGHLPAVYLLADILQRSSPEEEDKARQLLERQLARQSTCRCVRKG